MFVLVLVALVLLAVGGLRVSGFDGDQLTEPAVALTPYAGVGAVLTAIIGLLLHRRIYALLVGTVAIVLVVLVMPRFFASDQPAARGEHLRVMSANVNRGRADVAAIVNAVRANNVDVLNLPELTKAQLPLLDDAGLSTALPYRVVDPGNGGDGSGILSHYPLRGLAIANSDDLAQPSAVVDLPGPDDVEIVAVHVDSATHDANRWRTELSELPSTEPARVRVLAGDFNSTLDHAALREVISRGYVDAADETGNGLTPTGASWPFGPPITIDHVLVDHRCAVRSYSVLDLPGSDHNAVFTDLQLP
jgi:endonuclease/exonuclease/phosphatase family metal-dependent hydrolase